MKCTTCGTKTKVVDSRHCDSTASFRSQKQVMESVAWYTSDWVCRKRSCPKCQHVVVTVEILLDDLSNGWSPKI